MHVKKGDYVVVTTGDDKGKIGEVMSVYPKTGQIKVLGAKKKKKKRGKKKKKKKKKKS